MKKIDKILKYLENQGISLSNFERKAQLGYSYLGKTRDRGVDVTFKVLEKIRNNAPEDYYKIFPEEKKGDEEIGQTPFIKGQDDYDKIKEENKALKEEIERLNKTIEDKLEIIALQKRLLEQDKGEEEEIGTGKRKRYG